MTPQQLRDLEVEDLYLRLGELKEELFNLRFQLATGQLDNYKRLRLVKRDVARVRTVIREREIEEFEAFEEAEARRREEGAGERADAEVSKE